MQNIFTAVLKPELAMDPLDVNDADAGAMRPKRARGHESDDEVEDTICG